MKVTKLRATNFKGRTFEHDLAPITIFTGPNGAGKSARLEALQLALAGFVPGLSSKAGDIAETFGGTSDMAVGAIISGISKRDYGVIRSFKRKARGGIDYTVKCDGMSDDWAVSPVAVDPTKFTGLSGPAQTRYLFQMAKLTREVNAQTVTALIKNIKLEENTEATENTVSRICYGVEESHRVALKNGETAQEWLTDYRDFLKENYKLAKGNVERMNLTVQGITELRSKQPPSDQSIQDVERKLATARAEETRLTTILGEIEAQLKSADAQNAAITRLDAQLSGELADCTRQRDAAQAKMHEIMGRHGDKPDVESLMNRQNEVTRMGKALKLEVDGIEHRMEVARRDHAQKMAHTTCPFCKSKKQGWKDELVKEHEAQIEDLVIQRTAKEGQRGSLLTEFNALKAHIGLIDEKLIAWQAEENAITMWRNELESRNGLLGRREDALKRRAEMSPVDLVALTANKSTMQGALNNVRTTRAGLDADKLRLSSERTEALQKIQAARQAGETMAEAEVLKQALEAVNNLCETLVNESIGPVIARVNELCGPIMPANIEFVDGSIGWRENGAWIGRSVQYGGARGALLAVGLSIALSDPGGIVILHEFRNFDRSNRRKVLNHFELLIEKGVIGQVILADPDVSDIQGMDCVAKENICFITVK